MILRPGKPIKESLRATFCGKSGEDPRRELTAGSFSPLRPGGRLEINLPNYVFRDLRLEEGQEIQVAIRRNPSG